MDPKDFGLAILRRKASVITAVVVALAFAAYGSAQKAPAYTSSCSLLFEATADDPTEKDSKPFNPIGSQSDQANFIASSAQAQPVAELIKLPVDEVMQVGVTVDFDNTANLFVIKADDIGGPQRGAVSSTLPKYASQPGLRAADVCNARMQAYINYNLDAAEKHYRKLLKRKENLLAELYREVAYWERKMIEKDLNGQTISLETIERNQALNSITQVRESITGIRDTLRDGITGGGKPLEPAAAGNDVNDNLKRDLLMGLLMGLIFGVGFALVREYFDDTVKDKESTQRELGVPVLAMMPAAEEFEGYGELSPSTMESARALRTTLASLGVPHDKSVLLVTSTLAKRRSTTITSLAAALAESGRSVLVVGSDLRGGRTHEAFGVANTTGLANVIRGQVPFEKAIRPAPGMEGVYVMPCGPVIGNPGELLSSEGMALTLGRAQRWADVVLLDAPPVLAAADSSILGAYADGIVMVLSAGSTHRARASEAKEQLVSAGGRVLGVVLTDCEEIERLDTDLYGDDLGGMSGGGWGAYDESAYGDYYADPVTTTNPFGPRGTASRPSNGKAAASRAGQRPRSNARTQSVPRNARTIAKSGARKTTAGARKTTSPARKSTASKNGSTARKTATRKATAQATARKTTAPRKVSTARKSTSRTSTARKPAGTVKRSNNGKTVRVTVSTRGATRR